MAEQVVVPTDPEGQLKYYMEEVERLKAENAELKAKAGKKIVDKDSYEMANHVIMVRKEGKAEKVPLLKLFMDSKNRIDVREADTPVCGRLNQTGEPEEESVEEKSAKNMMVVEGMVDDDNQEDEDDEEPKKKGRRRPAPLNKGALKDQKISSNNGIVSKHTLKAFQDSWGSGGGAVSPYGSNVAESILDYLNHSFAKNYEHINRPGTIDAFGRHLIALCSEVTSHLKTEPLQLQLQAPIYVFGDIHGNFRDLHYFLSELVLFKNIKYTPHNFLFLGDYVDRGPHGIECVAMLFALKAISPKTLLLLRGNHEDRLVNGDVRTYGDGSLKAQCMSRFGAILGESVWKAINGAFKWLPLTAVIDDTIFCTHGGIPRFFGGADNRMARLRDTFRFPRFETFFECGPGEPAHIQMCREMAADCCWSDPAESEDHLNEHGFGENPRGQGIIVFGSKAVDDFLAKNDLKYIFRAHQEKSDGLKVSKNARVLTIFSTSDYIGHQNGAGVVFVSHAGTIRLIIKEPEDDCTHTTVPGEKGGKSPKKDKKEKKSRSRSSSVASNASGGEVQEVDGTKTMSA
eukprot:TRINITY_DN7632_c0_g1_i1.p1 TRINITY_DN7632_c0_g1~~TRINITY_DN7632_c0_g1_i1.p1  ORF type:complete len:585 (+),score=150.67 TRINITY_DN7632_c0_g1_i1:40-1755(+)